MRRAHLLVGVFGVLVFLGTGLYMRSGFPGLYVGNEALRYMYRANHIYLLLASLVNMVLGIYLAAPEAGWRALLSRIGSVLVVLSPVLLCYAFFAEVPKASPERVFTALGVFALAAGVVAQLPSYRVRGARA
jgi:FtsH-binding integral membrane protein